MYFNDLQRINKNLHSPTPDLRANHSRSTALKIESRIVICDKTRQAYHVRTRSEGWRRVTPGTA